MMSSSITAISCHELTFGTPEQPLSELFGFEREQFGFESEQFGFEPGRYKPRINSIRAFWRRPGQTGKGRLITESSAPGSHFPHRKHWSLGITRVAVLSEKSADSIAKGASFAF